jgi:putative transposase
MSIRAACGLVKVSRRRLRYVSRRNDQPLVSQLKELAASHPRYGSRMLWGLLRRQGQKVNLKRVRRLCRKHGLSLKAKRRRKRRGIGIGLPCQAEHPHHTWTWDFMEDRTESGRKLRILTVVDEFTRLCLTIEVEHRMNSRFVADTLMGLIAEHGMPRFVRSDNGPEFIARHLMRRDHARMICKVYGRQYNTERPHSSLKYLTPREFAAAYAASHGGNLRGDKTAGALPPHPRDLSLCTPPG